MGLPRSLLTTPAFAQELARCQSVIALYPQQVRAIMNVMATMDGQDVTVLDLDENRLVSALNSYLAAAGLIGAFKGCYLSQFDSLPI